MSQKTEFGKESEKISKEVLDIITKNHRSRFCAVSLMEILMKTHSEKEVCKALAFMCSEKLLDLTKKFKGTYGQYFELLDEDGKQIKNTMIGCYHDDQSFGIIYYKPSDIFEKTIDCHEHLEEQVKQTKSIIDEKCAKCFEERAQRICLEHNQSLEFCEKCQKQAEEFLEIGKTIGFEKVWEKIKKEHHAQYWAN